MDEKNNAILKNDNLSWKAKGLFCYLSSLAESEKITIEKLVKVSTDGRDSVRSALKELVNNGYLSYGEVRNGKGQFDYMYYKLNYKGF